MKYLVLFAIIATTQLGQAKRFDDRSLINLQKVETYQYNGNIAKYDSLKPIEPSEVLRSNNIKNPTKIYFIKKHRKPSTYLK